jgi:hypothetical protein
MYSPNAIRHKWIKQRTQEFLEQYDIKAIVAFAPMDDSICGAAGLIGKSRTPMIIFNEVLIEDNLEVFLTEVIPHEVAHVIQKVKYPWIKGEHNMLWRTICLWLGGNPSLYIDTN